MTSEDLLVDTNVLVYSGDTHSPFHPLAVDRLVQLTSEGARLVVSPQIVREYIRAVSRSRRISTAMDAKRLIDTVQRDFADLHVLDESAASVDRLYQLCSDYPAMLPQVHDANIVATMLGHGVRRILTHNTKHFEPVAHLIEIVPLTP